MMRSICLATGLFSFFCDFMKSGVDGSKVWAYNPAIERERRRFWRPTNSL
jgi:hypothetical protein